MFSILFVILSLIESKGRKDIGSNDSPSLFVWLWKYFRMTEDLVRNTSLSNK